MSSPLGSRIAAGLRTTALFLPLILVVSLTAHAQSTITPVVVEDDDITGVGIATAINNLAINDSGDWLVEVDTDAAVDFDVALVGPTGVLLIEGISPVTPATLGSFDGISLNNSGQVAFNFFLDGTVGGTSDDSGIYAYLDTTSALPDATVTGLARRRHLTGRRSGHRLLRCQDQWRRRHPRHGQYR